MLGGQTPRLFKKTSSPLSSPTDTLLFIDQVWLDGSAHKAKGQALTQFLSWLNKQTLHTAGFSTREWRHKEVTLSTGTRLPKTKFRFLWKHSFDKERLGVRSAPKSELGKGSFVSLTSEVDYDMGSAMVLKK